MPSKYPDEFRRDVVRAARASDSPVEQIARDFGVSKSALHRWLTQADIDDGRREGVTSEQDAELRALRKRTRELEQENEILRRAAAYFAKELPPKGSTR